ncbi:MAG: undecaprenyldiphospho-muramoylpentapeptide beta-N-acetylglucosaminyltransferase [Candidatus Hydrogenedentes bacterium]|nr:undecaprenyldiphospho-muramoylpentapeptide beta-N-acetylglucosaminyltransferase [Candidatus Hydrogenedentota bacterium]
MRILVTGGGTGGHTSPATAILEELQRRDSHLAVLWVGRNGAIESRVAASLAIPFRGLAVEGWPRRRTPRRVLVALKLLWAAVKSWLYIRKFKPQIVLGVGGYVSLPVMWVAQRMGIPTVLHEQNRLLGVTNRILAQKATRVFLSFPETHGEYPKDRSRVVGNPVRAAFASPRSQTEAREAFGLDPSIPVVLVSGGSQGAHSINAAMARVVKELRADEAQFIWMTGLPGAAAAHDAASSAAATVKVFPFIDDMAGACAAADLIVGRAGASSTAEIAVLHKPSVLIPYPHATDRHQDHNAKAFEEAGAAVVLTDEECTGDNMTLTLRSLLGDRQRLESMAAASASLAKPAAAENVAEEILAIVFEQGETA